MVGMKVRIQQLVNGLLKPLPKRQSDVIEGRYGLVNGNELTLAALGNKLGVTRERVRQIQNLALAEFRANRTKNGLQEFVGLVQAHLAHVGGVREGDALLTDLRGLTEDPGDTKTINYRLNFLLEASDAANRRGADKHCRAFWFGGADERNAALAFVDGLAKLLAGHKSAVLAEQKFNQLFSEAASAHKMNEMHAANIIGVSKKFSTSPYGEVGLTAWPEIHPKTARDWAYLVLKREENPLHFTAIADRINGVRTRKKTNFQTVHNELIKDTRFVLVGRGIYGLREFGLIEGTAREVMESFLKERGPMRAKELVQLVLEKRIFKENTLLLNLQKKDYFKRLDDGRYSVREA